MDAHRRTSTLRRVAMTASLAALITLPAGAADAKPKAKKAPKSPVITKVRPMEAQVGETLTLKGRHFRKGKAKNSVGFKTAGHSVVFVRSALSTKKTMTVKLPAKLEKVMEGPTRFKLRVLSKRFGKKYTRARLSPTIEPRPAKPGEPGEPTPPTDPSIPDPSCKAGDGDQDGDKLSDRFEADTLGTSACKADTDGDGVSDGYEFRSAVDFNDDEYQEPNRTLPYPVKLPYPNPLSPSDALDNKIDYDGDGLTLEEEFKLWETTTPPADRTFEDPVADANGVIAATPLNYSDGLQYSKSRRCGAGESSEECGPSHAGRRVPSLPAAGYDKWNDFTAWLAASGYATVMLHDQAEWFDHAAGRHSYAILDTNRSGDVDGREQFPLDRDNNGWLSDDERDEDADGMANTLEAKTYGRPEYWNGCYSEETPYPIAFAGTDSAKADTDGDGVRDGADDQDGDDVPNMMELSRFEASGFLDTEDHVEGTTTGQGGMPLCKPDADLLETTEPEPGEPTTEQPLKLNHPDAYGWVHPFNPCLPDATSRSCLKYFTGEPPAPFDDSPIWWSLQ